jgi:hypothetical protein
VRAPPKVLPPPAILAECDLLTGQPHFKAERRPLLDELAKATVWHQLNKRKPAIAHPRLIKVWSEMHLGAAPDEERTDRELALQMAFRGAFLFAISCLRTSTATEEKETVEFYRNKARQYQNDASFLGELSDEAAEHARALAAWHEGVADELDTGDNLKLVVHRHQKSPHVRAYCIMLAGVMRNLYGDVLREMVASIANAAFPHETVSKEHVRYWCK